MKTYIFAINNAQFTIHEAEVAKLAYLDVCWNSGPLLVPISIRDHLSLCLHKVIKRIRGEG
jgi:hypothetical protein